MLLLLAVCPGCGADQPRSALIPAVPLAGATVLPGLPEAGLPPRAAQSLQAHTFSAADVYAAGGASFAGSGLAMPAGGFSWVVLGVNCGGLAPTVLDLAGTGGGIYAAVSDYRRGCWRWLDGPRQGGGRLILPGGQWCRADGTFYIALAHCAPEAARLSPRVQVKVQAEWNVLVWMAGDNNLSSCATVDLSEMEAVGSSAQVQVLAGYDDGCSEACFTRIGPEEPGHPGEPEKSYDLSFPAAGFNSADPERLAAFLDWADTYYPARQAMLVLWGHGNGWQPGGSGKAGSQAASNILNDEQDGPSLATANTAVATALAGRHFDILAFDACNMGQIEALYDFRGLADYYVASECVVSGYGFAYDKFLSACPEHAPLTALRLGQLVVEAYLDDSMGYERLTLALIDGAGLGRLANAIADLNQAVSSDAATEWLPFQQAASETYTFDLGHDCRDLGQLVGNYRKYTQSGPVAEQLAVIQAELDAAVVNFAAVDYPGCTGLGIYLPPAGEAAQEDLAAYHNLAFNRETGWLVLLDTLATPAED